MAKIVVIEDNQLNLEFVLDLLEMLGEHEVSSAQTAERGLEIIQRLRPDLVLMDLNLPGMSGDEAIRLLRSRDETRNLPIIVLTAHAMLSDESRFDGLESVSYLTKPIDSRHFFAEVRRLL